MILYGGSNKSKSRFWMFVTVGVLLSSRGESSGAHRIVVLPNRSFIASAALLIVYDWWTSRFFTPLEWVNMGVFGSGGGWLRGGGRFCSMACWKGSVHGRLQN